MKPLRLCLIVSQFPPDLNGIGDYTYFLANALAREGCEVDVLTSVGSLDPQQYPLESGVVVHRAIRKWGLRALSQILGMVGAIRPDIVILEYAPHAFDRRGMTLGVNLLPILVRAIARVPVLTNVHELFIPYSRSPLLLAGALWQRAMALITAVSSSALTVTCSEWAGRLRRLGTRKRIDVIPVGSGIPKAPANPELRKATRQQLGIDDHTMLVGSLGASGQHRDTRGLVAAVTRANEEVPLRVMWLGKTGERPDSETQRSGLITWTGPLPHRQISILMSACDLFVLPFTDGVSTRRTTMAAAALHGLPVLTTCGGVVDDLFAHLENVYLVPAGDQNALMRGLVELLRDHALRKRIGQGATALFERMYRWDLIASRIHRIAQQAIVGRV